MKNEKYDVIIIGGGAAGLMAASVFGENKVSYLVLEARSRLGGRLYSKSLPSSQHVEFGPEFIHGEAKLTHKILNEAKIKTVGLSNELLEIKNGVVSHDQSYWAAVEKSFQLLKSKKDVSFYSAVKKLKNRDHIKALLNFVEGFDGADPKKLSLKSVLEEGPPEKNGFIVGGYKKLIQALAQKISPSRVKLDTEVKKISWEKDFVEVKLKNKKVYCAKKVLVTLPVSLLKSSSLFSPTPAPLKRALAYVEMGFASKVSYEMTEKFWKNFPIEGLIQTRSSPSVQVYWVRKPFLISWLGGPRSQKEDLSFHRRELQKNFALKSLKGMVKQTYFHDWEKDPYTKGAYSYRRPNGSKLHSIFEKPIAKTLYFAGEAFGQNSGTVEGALESGQLSAEKILADQ